jgi:hypothetical protein
MAPRIAAVLAAALLIPGDLGASQQPKLKDVLSRVAAYVDAFEGRMSNVVADEQYRQTLELFLRGQSPKTEKRTLRSDYALVPAADDRWVGFRDTYEVNGEPVRDRADRLLALLTRGEFIQASEIATESARLNLGSDYVTRNVNVPVFVLQMMHPRNQWRFSFSKSGEEMIGNVRTWRIEFFERERPTWVRTTEGRNQKTVGALWVDPATGEVWRTRAAWDAPKSTITVTYGHVDMLDVAVPLEMTERYESGVAAVVTGTATYSNYRQFQTAVRLVQPE